MQYFDEKKKHTKLYTDVVKRVYIATFDTVEENHVLADK